MFTDFQRMIVGIGGTSVGAVSAGTEHPATIAAAYATAFFMVVSAFYKIRNGGK